MKTSKTELCAKRAQAWEDCKNFLESHRQKDGTLTAEDRATYDKMVATVDALKTEIKTLEEVEARDSEMNEPTSRPVVNQPEKGKEEKKGRCSDAYKKLFEDYIRGVVSKNDIRNALQEGTGSKGGYLVPEEFERRVIDKLKELDVIRRYATEIRTSAKRNIPVEASAGEATWLDEEEEYAGTDPAFGRVELEAFKVVRAKYLMY